MPHCAGSSTGVRERQPSGGRHKRSGKGIKKVERLWVRKRGVLLKNGTVSSPCVLVF